jgi:transposase
LTKFRCTAQGLHLITIGRPQLNCLQIHLPQQRKRRQKIDSGLCFLFDASSRFITRLVDFMQSFAILTRYKSIIDVGQDLKLWKLRHDRLCRFHFTSFKFAAIIA